MYPANRKRYMTVSDKLGATGPKRKLKPARYVGVKAVPKYKIPKTPKVSGKGWGH